MNSLFDTLAFFTPDEIYEGFFIVDFLIEETLNTETQKIENFILV